MPQTTTDVHSMESMVDQRYHHLAHSYGTLWAVSLFAQVLSGASLFLFDHVSTPAYMSILLACIPLALLMLMGGIVLKRRAENQNALQSALGTVLQKIVSGVLALSLLLDAQLAMTSLSEVVFSSLASSLQGALTILMGVCIAATLLRVDEHALPRMAQFFWWILLVALIFGMANVHEFSNPGHLFPLFGQGGGSILKGALWITGSVATCTCTALMPYSEGTLRALKTQAKSYGIKMLLSLAGGAGVMLFYAYLLPYYALARDQAFYKRLMILLQFSPSSTGWILIMAAYMLLFLIAATNALHHSGLMITNILGPKRTRVVFVVLTLLTLSALYFNDQSVSKWLVDLLPYRTALVLLAMLAALIGSLVRKQPQKEAAA